MNTVDIYCDESAHLENDQSKYMVIGATYTRHLNVNRINNDIKKIKLEHGFTTDYEIKWTKISKANVELVKSLISYFFENPKLRFRGYIIDKSNLNHNRYNQDHDTWYYKMFYNNLTFIVEQTFDCNVYLDIKDTKSQYKVSELFRILNIPTNPFNYGSVKKVQVMQSYESQLIQLTDIFIGALRYKKAGLDTSENKLEIIQHLKDKSKQSFKHSSPLSNLKFNVFLWNSNFKAKEW